VRFTRFGRYDFNDTPRKRAAYVRKLKAEQDAMPLFAELIAEQQGSVDDEMTTRREHWNKRQAAERQRRAMKWREARQRLRTYPEPIRAELLAYWQQCTWPGDPTYFLSMLHMHDTGRLELPGRGGG